MRSATACFCAAGLFDDADGDLLVAAIERSKRTRMPGGRGLQVLEELERNLQAKRAA
jgi:hypothetical protein